VPQGHAGHTGKIDLLIQYGRWAILAIEVKTCSADASDTVKQKGYKNWIDSQECEHKLPPVLIATDAKNIEYEGFQFVSWRDICLELRWVIPELQSQDKLLTGAMILAFVGAVEQNLLGFSARRLKKPGARRVSAFNPKIIDHLEAYLKGRGAHGNA